MAGKKRVLFIGLSCLDIVSYLDDFPREDTDQRISLKRWSLGGNASNNSVVFSQLKKWRQSNGVEVDLEVEYAGCSCNDLSGQFLRDIFNKNEIIIDNIDLIDGETPSSCILVCKKNATRTILYYNKNHPEFPKALLRNLDLTRYRWIHFEGRSSTDESLDSIMSMVKYLNEQRNSKNLGFKISVELEKCRPRLAQFFSERLDCFFIQKEFALSQNWNDKNDAIYGASKMVKNDCDIVCCWGESGSCSGSVKNGQLSAISDAQIFRPINGAIDSLGAGDTFLASVLFKVNCDQDSFGEAIEFASKVAGIKVGVIGLENLKEELSTYDI